MVNSNQELKFLLSTDDYQLPTEFSLQT